MPQTTVSLAKITRPQMATVVRRERLLKRLDEGCRRAVAWVAGPPGCGKTTLLSSYLELRKPDYLWYQLDEGDADVATFFYYMSQTAMRHGHVGRDALPVFSPEVANDIAVFSRRFFRELFRHMKRPFLIVLDNYQDISPQSPLHEGLNAAFAELPTKGCIVAISRNEPPLQMVRLRANQQLEVIDWKELRMTRDEVAQLVEIRGEQAPEQLIDVLLKETDGWAAGLVLMLEQRRRGSIPGDSMDGLTREVIFEYLAGEIFRHFDDDVRCFLLTAAWLPRMSIEMARTLSDNPDAGAVLVNLTQNNYFVTERREDDERRFQFHPLFREFLTNQSVARFDETEINSTRRRAAALLLEDDQVDEAVQLLIDAAAWDELSGVVLDRAADMIEASRGEMLAQWLENLPEETIATDPQLLYWFGSARLYGAPREARRYYEAAWQRFNAEVVPDPESAILSCCGVIDTILAELDDLTLLDTWVPALEALLRDHPEFADRALVSRCMLMSLVLHRPGHPEIENWITRSIHVARNTAGVRDRIPIQPMIVVALLLAGQFTRAAELIERARQVFDAGECTPPEASGLHLVESMYAMLTGDGQRCLQAVDDGLELLHSLGMRSWRNLLIANGVGGALALGEYERAEQLLSSWEISFRGVTRVDRCLFHYFSAWARALRKDPVGAYQDLKEALALALEVDMPFLEIVCRSALAQVLFDCGDERKGSAQLRKVHALARDIKNPLLEFMTLLTYGQIALDRGRKRPALNALQYALGLGREYAFKHVLWWQPDVMSRLCMHALEVGMEEEYVRDLIGARDLFPETPPLRLANWPWRYRITTLGKFLITREGEAITLSSKAQGRPVELLKALIALGGRDVRADQLAQSLWPHVDSDYAYRSFTTALHRLRRLLDADEAVLLQEGRVSLSHRLCWVDVWALDQVLDDSDMLVHDPKLSLDTKALNDIVAEVLSYYRGAFLEDELDQTTYALYREQIRNRLRRNLAQLSTRLEEVVGFDTVVGLYEKLIDSDPLAEALYRDLMQRYAGADRRADALEIFVRCRNALQATQRQPSAETMTAYEEIVNAA